MTEYATIDDIPVYSESRSRGESFRHRVYKLRDERGNKCQRCPTKERFNKGKSNLQFAHIKPTSLNGRGRGQTQRFRDIVTHPDCYELLCVGCHTALDRG